MLVPNSDSRLLKLPSSSREFSHTFREIFAIGNAFLANCKK
ncbi:hypothetical protein BN1224_CV14_A_04660 [Chlamydia pneumoniae]|uniref:Uncharacterized protein n=1 Tax=Chlamydia pneumoniae TaxID=83558 RepID=A0A0F7XFC3_CHLPN|nr:hypothetical protein BN1224_Wien1_A_04630 [Chlamydia pneumoniae]CRI35820.1 hypothetical protein BN1224_CM1_A_04670 [Chlamydia pneumoniae]CRI36947.1 hypothetical protein BN1224_CV14_A_04660 [Chlamydia pneumoniae]CRI38071.1 hypothetical protein BN1224_CV15_B_03940 [Chlamydia pneumoniae]CRI39204.1 hypothetical protein BN1224_CWL011_A_04680 [Chlamydia pneumoniae]